MRPHAPTLDLARVQPKRACSGPDSPFYIPPFLDFLGALVYRFRDFWVELGRLESSILQEQLSAIAVRKPVYVCGLARAGSTLLHEIVASAPHVATHRIKDFPMVYTPYWWRQATARRRPGAPRERAHRDRVLITPESPDALEEMIWMAFFPRCHDPWADHRLEASSSYPAFEAFYRSHLTKLLLAERATRYAAKANYHVGRLGYLVRLFPDAKFILPVREPVSHIASLIRQHQWFCRGQKRHPRALAWMQRSGHFEFGLDRRPMNLGDCERVQVIRRAWAAGEEIRGWALYWDMLYSHLACLLHADARVRAATKAVYFEDLCAAPAKIIREILDHCGLPDAERIVARFAPSIRFPDYYDSPFSPAEVTVIHEETAATANAIRSR